MYVSKNHKNIPQDRSACAELEIHGVSKRVFQTRLNCMTFFFYQPAQLYRGGGQIRCIMMGSFRAPSTRYQAGKPSESVRYLIMFLGDYI